MSDPDGAPRPHDLLVLRPGQHLVERHPDATPAWVAAALRRSPTVVVRRGRGGDGLVPVGVRGAGRSRRHGSWVPSGAIAACVGPEELAAALDGEPRPGPPDGAPSVGTPGDGAPGPDVPGDGTPRLGVPGLDVRTPGGAMAGLLRDVAHRLEALAWGPVGSVGFELLTGVVSTTATSDLDLVVRAPEPRDPQHWARLGAALSRLGHDHGRRVDCQVETPSGGVHLDELAAGAPLVLVRADDGPILVRDPWAPLRERG